MSADDAIVALAVELGVQRYHLAMAAGSLTRLADLAEAWRAGRLSNDEARRRLGLRTAPVPEKSLRG